MTKTNDEAQGSKPTGTQTPQPWETGRRFYPRWYFHDPEVPFAEQTRGIAAELWRPGVLFDSLIGRIVIKDMSLGGVGFLAPRRFELPERVLVVLAEQEVLGCEILHRRPVSQELVFYGARWHGLSHRRLARALSRYARLCLLVC